LPSRAALLQPFSWFIISLYDWKIFLLDAIDGCEQPTTSNRRTNEDACRAESVSILFIEALLTEFSAPSRVYWLECFSFVCVYVCADVVVGDELFGWMEIICKLLIVIENLLWQVGWNGKIDGNLVWQEIY